MKIFKVEAERDTTYIMAMDQAAAQKRLFELTGPIPVKLLTWTIVPKLPKGEELLSP